VARVANCQGLKSTAALAQLAKLDLQPEPCRRRQSSAVKFPAGPPMAVGNFRVKPAPFNSKYHHRGNFLAWLQPSKYRVFEIKTKKSKK
jgi:hypothetical protein